MANRVQEPRHRQTVKQSDRVNQIEWAQNMKQLGTFSSSLTAHPTVMSKMLLPTELDTAMSPRPFRATITLVIRSGMDVPAARMVRPIISSEMPMVSPTYKRTPGFYTVFFFFFLHYLYNYRVGRRFEDLTLLNLYLLLSTLSAFF